jgi:hypothetical protein
MYRRGAGSPFPAQAIVGDGIVWPNELQSTQMKLLSAAVFAVEPSLMEWEFGVTCFPPNGEKSEIKRWSCVDLMLVLTKLAENTTNNTNRGESFGSRRVDKRGLRRGGYFARGKRGIFDRFGCRREVVDEDILKLSKRVGAERVRFDRRVYALAGRGY